MINIQQQIEEQKTAKIEMARSQAPQAGFLQSSTQSNTTSTATTKKNIIIYVIVALLLTGLIIYLLKR